MANLLLHHGLKQSSQGLSAVFLFAGAHLYCVVAVNVLSGFELSPQKGTVETQQYLFNYLAFFLALGHFNVPQQCSSHAIGFKNMAVLTWQYYFNG